MVLLSQSDIFGSIIFFVLFFVLIFLYPRLMLSQMIYKLEQSARKLENMTQSAVTMNTKKSGRNSRKRIEGFSDFFVVEPSSLDPYGIVKKIDRTIRGMEDRFDAFVDSITSGDYDHKQELNYGLRATLGLRQISKIVRHYVEIAKKFRNLQIAMILQMQLPIIEKIAESELKGTEAFLNGWPIGDSIGPLVAASYMDKSSEVAEDIMLGRAKIDGRNCYVLKAKGPSPHLGRIDEAIEHVLKKHKIRRVITIDAAAKLEGEESGSVAEGVGFAMGGWAQRELIENTLFPKGVPIDSVVIKVGIAEAIKPMTKDVFKSLEKSRTFLEEAVKREKKRANVLIIGVGNSSGVGNDKSVVSDVEKIVNKLEKKRKREEEAGKKKRGWF